MPAVVRRWRSALSGVVVLLLMGGVFLVQRQITTGAFDHIESRQVAEDAERLRIGLDDQVELLAGYGATNSIWDSSFDDLRLRNTKSFLADFPPKELKRTFGVDGLLGVSSSGELRLGGLIQGDAFVAPPTQLSSPDVLRGMYSPSDAAGRARCGAISAGAAAYVYCGIASYPSDSSGRPAGGLIYLKTLDAAGVAALGQHIAMPLQRLDEQTAAGEGERELTTALGTLRVSTRVVSSSRIALLVRVPTSGGSSLFIQALRDRPIHRTAGTVSLQIFGSVVGLGVLLAIAVLILVRRGVRTQVVPLRELTQEVISSGDRSLRIGAAGSGEIGALAATIDTMLDSMAEQDAEHRRLQQDREAQLRAAFVQQRLSGQHVRRRAQAVIDETVTVLVKELHEVVAQSDAMRTAVESIDSRVRDTDTVARVAEAEASDADEVAEAVRESLRRVGGIAQLITTVAEQTKLLALNATIEAARAGEAGRGFRVVANEVKALATATTRSTGEIAETIGALERDVQAMATVIADMTQGVGGIGAHTEGLTAATSDQRAAIGQLSEAVAGALERVQALSTVTSAVERRRWERMGVSGEVSLVIRGETVEADLLDLSEGGARCVPRRETRAASGDQVTLLLAPGDETSGVSARVVRSSETEDGLELGLEFLGVTPAVERRVLEYIGDLLSSRS